MLPAFPIPIIGDKSVPLRRLMKAGGNVLNCVLSQSGNIPQTNAGTQDFTANVSVMQGATPFQGVIVPEPYLGARAELVVDNTLWGASGLLSAVVSTTGAVNAIVRARYLLPTPLAAGATISGWSFTSQSGVKTGNALYEDANTGTTGTNTLTGRLRKLSADGSTLTTLGTDAATTFNFDGAVNVLNFNLVNTFTPVSLSDGEFVVLELELNVNQTARSAGAAGVGIVTYNGFAYSSLRYTMNQLTVNFD